MLKKSLLLLSFSVIAVSMHAQHRAQKYDSIYNDNLFLPNFSNLLMPKGYVEAIVSDALSSTNKFWPNEGEKDDFNFRSTYHQVAFIANVGLSKTNRFNIGVEAHYMRIYDDENRKSSPLNIFKRSPEGKMRAEDAFTSVGPRFKWRPLRNNYNFVHTSTFQYSIAPKDQKMISSAHYWSNQFLYSFSSGKRFSFFLADDLNVFFNDATTIQNSLNLYSYWIASKHFFPFISAGQSVTFGGTGDAQHTLPVGLGLQYQHSMRFSINFYYNQPAWGKNANDWRTLSLGARAVF